MDRLQVELAYLDRHGAETERTVHPLGLVEKGRSWYLVADTAAGRRTFRLTRIRAVTVTETAAVRPDGFDLETARRNVAASVEQRRTATRAVALVRPRILDGLRAQLGDDLAVLGTAPDGRAEIEVAGVTAEVIADELAGYGEDVEVVAPPAVRAHLARLGRELVGLYEEPDAPANERANEPADRR